MEQIDDLFNSRVPSEEDSHGNGSLPQDAADAQAQVRKGSPSGVVELGKEFRDDLEICFDDGESIFKDDKTENLLYLLNVKISEL